MTTTTYYDLNIVEGTDIVNPLTVDNPNYEKIDEVMHNNSVSGVTLATEIANATVHAITRENSECAVIRFIATSEWKAGDTVTVDGVPVTALLPSGEILPEGAYVINANVLCILTGTNLTVYAERKKIDSATEISYGNTNVAAAITKLNSDLANIGTVERLGNINQVGGSITLPEGRKVSDFRALGIRLDVRDSNGYMFSSYMQIPKEVTENMWETDANRICVKTEKTPAEYGVMWGMIGDGFVAVNEFNGTGGVTLGNVIFFGIN